MHFDRARRRFGKDDFVGGFGHMPGLDDLA